ncbi:hypothetical protein [Sporosarcina ureilytica]|uniref:Yip1 domain-containing protein n=1 Tax=Sporosarcina ureilytica TaxID=298596 RepID=A0A1D8JJC2_9BACL|nr:hypothetical protein [Sporosarcina ureilytica]AOV08807.1 hypothetical protein BI350_15475 [Sporosarcina ureilytica]
MFFNFTFRHFLTNPRRLAFELENSTMRGFWKRVILVFIASMMLFSLRSLWGVNTESLTPLMTTMSTADYTLARYASLFGSMFWSLLYVAFHLFGVAYVLSFIIGIPFKKLLPMQLLMTSLLLIEKALVFLVFYMTGTATNVSFLSFGPLAATFLELPFSIFFFNQLTLTTAMIIGYQYTYIRTATDISKKGRLLFTLIAIHILMAIFTASIGLLPIESLFNSIVGGGAGHE